MAEINTEGGGGHKKKGSKPQPKKKSTRVDFTPMVDLGFLLITFFMLTTTMNKPSAMEITVPDKTDKKDENPTKIPESAAMTVILSENNKIFYYKGLSLDSITLKETDFSANGIRKIFLEENNPQIIKLKALEQEAKLNHLPDSTIKRKTTDIFKDLSVFFVIVKAEDNSSYKNLVDMMDEIKICDIGKYGLADLNPVELKKLEEAKNKF